MDVSNPLKIYKQQFHAPLPDDLKNCIADWANKHFILENMLVEK